MTTTLGGAPPGSTFGTAGLLPAGVVVLGTSEDEGPNVTGQYVNGRTITFQLASGDVGTVWIPYAQLSSSNVVEAITPIVQQIEAIYNLSNPAS